MANCCRGAAVAAALLLALTETAWPHDIPNDVTVQAFLKPAGQRLQLLVRVPMKAMRDIDYPKRAGGYVNLERVDTALRDAAMLWVTPAIVLNEGGERLPEPQIVESRMSIESDKSFASFESALAHVQGARLPNDLQIFWDQALLEVLLEFPIRSERSEFSIEPRMGRLGLRVVTVLRFLPPGGAVRAFEFLGDPGRVRLDPRWHQAALRFVGLGFEHILGGVDHLLFLFCLVIPFRRLRSLIPVVTAFTVAHSITLIASAYDLAPNMLWFPPLIETLIAMSIVYMALENIVGAMSVERRWLIAFGFGLVHGFGFSFALRETLQFAGTHLLVSLLSFNVGIELGQLLLLLLLIPLLDALFLHVVVERMGTVIVSALVAHTAWHWMIGRGERLWQFPFGWPEFRAAFWASVLRWLMAAVILAGLVWFVAGLLRRRAERGTDGGEAQPG